MLAIVIPYYKRTFFEATLQSLANQTDQRFKLYIGDDASPENPSHLLAKYQNKIDFHYHRFEENLGSISLVMQWERCIAMVGDEEWVMILGDDDVLESNCVAAFYENLNEIGHLKINVIRFATKVINSDGVPISKVYMHPKLEMATDFLIRKFNGGIRSSLSEYVFRKQILETIKFKDLPLAWSSDILAVIEFSSNNNIFTINDSLVFFRLSGMNITSQVDSIEKNNAKFQFYVYLLANYGKQYPKELVFMLLERLEKTQLNNKKTPLRWIKLFWFYFRFSHYSRFFSLFLKIKKSIK